jgi:hypothetical protein
MLEIIQIRKTNRIQEITNFQIIVKMITFKAMILMEKKFLIKMILFKIKSINISTIKVLILLKIKKKYQKEM